MRRMLLVGVSLIAFSTLAPAQQRELPRGLGYLFVAPGTVSDFYGRAKTLGFGGGGEWLVYRRLGAGFDASGLLIFRRNNTIAGFAPVSLNGTYHFVSPNRIRNLDPFVTAGYSIGIFGGGIDHGWFNFGGGANFWLREGLGLRLEFRDLVEPNSGIADDPRDHFPAFRIGLVWR